MTKSVVGVHEARTHLSQLLQRVMRGEEVLIARRSRVVARAVRLLLDAHVLLWAHAAPERPGRGTAVAQDPANEPFVSAAGAWSSTPSPWTPR